MFPFEKVKTDGGDRGVGGMNIINMNHDLYLSQFDIPDGVPWLFLFIKHDD